MFNGKFKNKLIRIFGFFMKALKYLLLYSILSAFLISALAPINQGISGQKKFVESEVELEDTPDTTDPEDEREDNSDDSKEKELGKDAQRHFRAAVSIAIVHQMELFSLHHPTVKTPPPRG